MGNYAEKSENLPKLETVSSPVSDKREDSWIWINNRLREQKVKRFLLGSWGIQQNLQGYILLLLVPNEVGKIEYFDCPVW